MSAPLIPARLQRTGDGTPFSAAYGDVYHSAHGGPEQARHVFLAGNDLPGRWRGRERFTVLETGFGLGLNFLATATTWAADPERPATLHFVSLEKHPFAAADLADAHADWPQFATLAPQLHAVWPPLVAGRHTLTLADGRIVLTLIFGDAIEALPQLAAESAIAADAFYLDGFSPAKNPELWSPALFQSLARLAAPEATLATWSVAGHVRAGLATAGFTPEKRPGFAGKRQMLHARLTRSE